MAKKADEAAVAARTRKAKRAAERPAETTAPKKLTARTATAGTGAGAAGARRSTAQPNPETEMKAHKQKQKVVRDSFTMPQADYDKIALLKKRCLQVGVSVKKGELLRAGLTALENLSVEKLAAVVGSVESIKTGRPASERQDGETA